MLTPAKRAQQAPGPQERFHGSHKEENTGGYFQTEPSQPAGRGVLLSAEVPWGENLQTKMGVGSKSRILIQSTRSQRQQCLLVKVILGWVLFPSILSWKTLVLIMYFMSHLTTGVFCLNQIHSNLADLWQKDVTSWLLDGGHLEQGCLAAISRLKCKESRWWYTADPPAGWGGGHDQWNPAHWASWEQGLWLTEPLGTTGFRASVL